MEITEDLSSQSSIYGLFFADKLIYQNIWCEKKQANLGVIEKIIFGE